MNNSLVKLDTNFPIWDKFFIVHPLVIIGTTDRSGDQNFAPKHMAMPMSWENYFGFVCSSEHSTYVNTQREKYFTVSFPVPDQILFTSLAAATREGDDTKPALKALPIIELEGMTYLEGCYLLLKCELFKVIDGFGKNSLITGRVSQAHIRDSVMRGEEKDDNDLISKTPMMAYLHPTRFASIKESNSFPFPSRFSK